MSSATVGTGALVLKSTVTEKRGIRKNIFLISSRLLDLLWIFIEVLWHGLSYEYLLHNYIFSWRNMKNIRTFWLKMCLSSYKVSNLCTTVTE